MSIYSGFATRSQEEIYDHFLEGVLYILQKRVLKFYHNEKADEEKFISSLNKLYHQMKSMEKHKYLEPKLSTSFSQLMTFLKHKQVQEASILNEKHRFSDVQSHQISENEAFYFENTQKSRPLTGTHIRARYKSINAKKKTPFLEADKSVEKGQEIQFHYHLPQKEKKKVQIYSSNSISKVKEKPELQQNTFKINSQNKQSEKGKYALSGYISKTKRSYSKQYQKTKDYIERVIKDKF